MAASTPTPVKTTTITNSPVAKAPLAVPAAVKVGFFSTSVGHLIMGAVVTGVTAVISALVKDPAFTTIVLGGGGTVTVLKFIVDLINHQVPNL